MEDKNQVKDVFKEIYGSKFMTIPTGFSYKSFKKPVDELYLESDGTIQTGTLSAPRITLKPEQPKRIGKFKVIKTIKES